MQRPHRVLIGVFAVLASLGCASEPDDLFGEAAGGSAQLPANGGFGAGGSIGVTGGSGAVVPDPEQPATTSGGNTAQGGSTAEEPAAGAGGTSEEPPASGGMGAGGASGGTAAAGASGASSGGSTAQTGGTSQGGRVGTGGGAGRGGAGSGGTLSGRGGSASGGTVSSATCRELRREMDDALREAQVCRPDGQGRQCAEFVDDECGCARPVNDARALLVVAYEVARDAMLELCPLTCTPMVCAAQPRSATCEEAPNGTNVCSAAEGPPSGPGNPGPPGGN